MWGNGHIGCAPNWTISCVIAHVPVAPCPVVCRLERKTCYLIKYNDNEYKTIYTTVRCTEQSTVVYCTVYRHSNYNLQCTVKYNYIKYNTLQCTVVTLVIYTVQCTTCIMYSITIMYSI